ncbi:hypothetical protein LXL04_034815 [Taraxacum kok-saghyz]
MCDLCVFYVILVGYPPDAPTTGFFGDCFHFRNRTTNSFSSRVVKDDLIKDRKPNFKLKFVISQHIQENRDFTQIGGSDIYKMGSKNGMATNIGCIIQLEMPSELPCQDTNVNLTQYSTNHRRISSQPQKVADNELQLPFVREGQNPTKRDVRSPWLQTPVASCTWRCLPSCPAKNRYQSHFHLKLGWNRNQSYLHLKSGGRLNLGLIRSGGCLQIDEKCEHACREGRQFNPRRGVQEGVQERSVQEQLSKPRRISEFATESACRMVIRVKGNKTDRFGTRFLPAQPTSEDILYISANYRGLSKLGHWFQLNCSLLRFIMNFPVTVRVSLKTGTAGAVAPPHDTRATVKISAPNSKPFGSYEFRNIGQKLRKIQPLHSCTKNVIPNNLIICLIIKTTCDEHHKVGNEATTIYHCLDHEHTPPPVAAIPETAGGGGCRRKTRKQLVKLKQMSREAKGLTS